MLRSPWWWVPGALLSLVFPFPIENAHGNTDPCTTGDSTAAAAAVVGQYHVFRPGMRGVDFTWRDLEFMWGTSYPLGLSPDAQTTLRKFASTLVEDVGYNAFGASLSKIHLAYNYFSMNGATYNTTDPNDSTSMVLARNTSGYFNADKSHVDIYLKAGSGAQWPAAETEAYEDTSSGHPVNLANPSLTPVRRFNSISAGGPGIGFHIDLTGAGWTHRDKVHAMGFTHEFVHAMNPMRFGGFMMDEMFADASEAVVCKADTITRAEVPYTWPLTFSHVVGCSDCCNNPRDALSSNDQGRSLFTAYLAYNFRGADTTETANGLNDDLLRRWGRATLPDPLFTSLVVRHMGKLTGLLGNDSCGTCVGKNYGSSGFGVGKRAGLKAT